VIYRVAVGRSKTEERCAHQEMYSETSSLQKNASIATFHVSISNPTVETFYPTMRRNLYARLSQTGPSFFRGESTFSVFPRITPMSPSAPFQAMNDVWLVSFVCFSCSFLNRPELCLVAILVYPYNWLPSCKPTESPRSRIVCKGFTIVVCGGQHLETAESVVCFDSVDMVYLLIPA